MQIHFDYLMGHETSELNEISGDGDGDGDGDLNLFNSIDEDNLVI